MIRTQECYRVEGADFRFQFHKGTIRTLVIALLFRVVLISIP